MTDKPNKSLKILVALLGARMHYAIPVAFERSGVLAHFYTDYYHHQGPLYDAITKLGISTNSKFIKRISARHDKRLPEERVSSFNYMGISYAINLRLSKSSLQRQRCYLKYGRQFASNVRDSNWYDSNAIYALNIASKELFKKGKEYNVTCILEQIFAPMQVANKLMVEEHSYWSNWQDTVDVFCNELIDREQAEWELADGIICGSQFVIDGIRSVGRDNPKSYLVPYTADIEMFYPNLSKDQNGVKNKPLHVLFVGQLDIRKGIQYLFEAVKKLNSDRIQVKIIGHNNLTGEGLRKLSTRCQVIEFVPRTELAEHYRWADVFVFPSICEGSALVIYEALASGLPVITTPNSGSIVQDGVDGFIVPIRNSDAIAERLDQFAQDRKLVTYMGRNAKENAVNNLSWKSYTERLLFAITEIQKRKSS